MPRGQRGDHRTVQADPEAIGVRADRPSDGTERPYGRGREPAEARRARDERQRLVRHRRSVETDRGSQRPVLSTRRTAPRRRPEALGRGSRRSQIARPSRTIRARPAGRTRPRPRGSRGRPLRAHANSSAVPGASRYEWPGGSSSPPAVAPRSAPARPMWTAVVHSRVGPWSVISRTASPPPFPTRRFASRAAAASAAPPGGIPNRPRPGRPRTSWIVVRKPGSRTRTSPIAISRPNRPVGAARPGDRQPRRLRTGRCPPAGGRSAARRPDRTGARSFGR